MEQHEIDIIRKHMDDNAELKKLWEEHLEFERKLEELEKRPYVTPVEQTEIKRLKKCKLTGKTKIQEILDQYSKHGVA